MEQKIYLAKDIAQWFVNRTKFDGEVVDKIKLQKLLYFAQACHLLFHNTPLFSDEISAFSHGPVIKSVYPLYAEVKGNKIDKIKNVEVDIEKTEFLEKIYQVFGKFATWKLVEMSHQERAFNETVKDAIITQDKITKYFEENNKENIKEFNKTIISEDFVDLIYFTNKHYSAFKALSK